MSKYNYLIPAMDVCSSLKHKSNYDRRPKTQVLISSLPNTLGWWEGEEGGRRCRPLGQSPFV